MVEISAGISNFRQKFSALYCGVRCRYFRTIMWSWHRRWKRFVARTDVIFRELQDSPSRTAMGKNIQGWLCRVFPAPSLVSPKMLKDRIRRRSFIDEEHAEAQCWSGRKSKNGDKKRVEAVKAQPLGIAPPLYLQLSELASNSNHVKMISSSEIVVSNTVSMVNVKFKS